MKTVVVLGDKTAEVLADDLRSLNIQVVNSLEQANCVVFAVDGNAGPMPIHLDILIKLSLTKNQEFLAVITNTNYLDDIDVLELVELELRDLFTTQGLPGNDVIIMRYPSDSNSLISYLKDREKAK